MSTTSLAEDLKASLGRVYASKWSTDTSDILFAPNGFGTQHSLEEAYQLVDRVSNWTLPDFLLPLALVDERSLACVVLNANDYGLEAGNVVRWHLDAVAPEEQLALLDVDPLLYIDSLDQELRARTPGLDRMLDQIGPAYAETHIRANKRPRDYVVRPIRIACQNVIVGLAAIAQEASFDGLSVVAWQTCEVPHVATHEANRALAALTLCDAFRNGGTMEIRFDRPATIMVDGKRASFEGHPEGGVPASLRRFGRTVGIVLGADDPGAITPTEARELFLACTPMPPALRDRVEEAIEACGIPPERLCYTLLSQVWREIELDYILATSSRSASILDGGAEWTDRPSRQAESDVCRAALMTGMLFRRLNSTDAAGADGTARVVEDRKRGVDWTIDAELGAVRLSGLDPDEPLPWTTGRAGATALTIVPRGMPPTNTAGLLAACASADEAGTSGESSNVALLLPADVPAPSGIGDVAVLRCPDRLADIDKMIESKLLASRISR